MWSCTQADLAGLVRDRHLVEKVVEELEKRIKNLEDEVEGSVSNGKLEAV